MLPRQFQPTATYDLIRLGRNHDGGYLVDPTSVTKAESLISFGLSTDWSFEKDFLGKNNVPLLAYDGTIAARHLFRRVMKNLLRIRLRKLFSSGRILMDYYSFFKPPRVHHHLNIGYDSRKSISPSSLLKKENPATPLFIKMDIEGSEYRVLNDLLEHSSSISGLVVEFHDVDLHRERILSFLEEFPLALVHTHSNNCGQLVDLSGDPITLELSFSAFPTETASQPSIPHPLDQENCPREKDLPLRFDNDSSLS